MKLRKNALSPLRFDPSGAFHEEFGVSKGDFDRQVKELESIRDAIVEIELKSQAGTQGVLEATPLRDVGFFSLPNRLLEEYTRDRQGSELGRLFKVANRMHASVDRVVVLSTGGFDRAARALTESCRQPYWNELSRGERGSKPRLYFEGNHFDNDAAQGLLYLLGDHEQRIARDEHESWGLIVISQSGTSLDTAVALRPFLAALQTRCGGDRTKLDKLVISVAGEGSELQKVLSELGCTQVFPVPVGIQGSRSALSAVGLVPAAMLGINVIELLQGAVAMNEQFTKAPAAENIVLQYVAVNHLLEKQRGIGIRVMSLWSKALESVGLWYDQLASENLGQNEFGFASVTSVNPRDLHSRLWLDLEGKRGKVFNNILVDTHRFDDLAIGNEPSHHALLNEITGKTLSNLMAAATQATHDAHKADGRPFTNLHIPRVDELHLGQLFQMLMIALVVEGRLTGVNPGGQPGGETYKKNLNCFLGRGTATSPNF